MDIEFQEMSISHAEQVAKLHTGAIPYSINGILGARHLERIYLDGLQNELIRGVVAIQNREKVVAFISWTGELNSSSKLFFRSFRPIGELNHFVKLFSPNGLESIFDLVSLSRTLRKINDFDVYVLAWGSLGVSAGSGIGVFLKFLDQAKLYQWDVMLDVRRENIRVLEVYKRLGFDIVQKTKLSYLIRKSFASYHENN